jgi:cell division protein FtsB
MSAYDKMSIEDLVGYRDDLQRQIEGLQRKFQAAGAALDKKRKELGANESADQLVARIKDLEAQIENMRPKKTLVQKARSLWVRKG